jgi:hypothetical protein
VAPLYITLAQIIILEVASALRGEASGMMSAGGYMQGWVSPVQGAKWCDRLKFCVTCVLGADGVAREVAQVLQHHCCAIDPEKDECMLLSTAAEVDRAREAARAALAAAQAPPAVL